jgi:hypothetical protein
MLLILKQIQITPLWTDLLVKVAVGGVVILTGIPFIEGNILAKGRELLKYRA